jgi:site-specific recombinase XerD
MNFCLSINSYFSTVSEKKKESYFETHFATHLLNNGAFEFSKELLGHSV